MATKTPKVTLPKVATVAAKGLACAKTSKPVEAVSGIEVGQAGGKKKSAET